MERLPGLGRQAEWRLVEVGLIWCGVVKARMRSAAAVEIEISANRAARLADALVGVQVHLLVFDAAPQPFDEHVVAPGAPAIHADGDGVTGEHAGEGRAGPRPPPASRCRRPLPS